MPPRPERVLELLDDLVEFINASEYPAVIKAAIAHAQFETIHPFMDGNGRVGRAFVHVIASKIGGVPLLSLVLVGDRQRYLEYLNAYRQEDDGSSGAGVNAWVDYFAQALVSSCERVEALDTILADVKRDWNTKVSFRRGSVGTRILSLLITDPVVTLARVTELSGGSYESCRVAMKRLQEAGIVYQSSRNRKSGLFVAKDVIDVLTSLERAASTRTGSARLERPQTPDPQRARVGVTIPSLD